MSKNKKRFLWGVGGKLKGEEVECDPPKGRERMQAEGGGGTEFEL